MRLRLLRSWVTASVMACVLACGVTCTALWTSGCLVLQLHPAYDDTSLLFDEALLGNWRNEDDRATALVERGEWGTYRITYTDATTKLAAVGRLTAIGPDRYLDLAVTGGEDRGPLLVPVHGLCRVVVAGDRLEVEALSFDRLEALVARKDVVGLDGLAATRDGRGNVVMTSGTRTLRAWLAKRSMDARVFAPAAVFKRSE